MTWLWWIGGIAVVFFVIRQGTAVHVGRTAPFPVVALAYLRQQLNVAGVLNRIPAPCIEEIAGFYSDRIESEGLKRGAASVELVKCIDAATEFIVGWIVHGREYPVGSVLDLPDGEMPPLVGTGWLPGVLQQHGVALGGGVGEM